ncbi:MAG: ABC transporter ATP-binding protein [Lysobacterales bacterium 69-70]|nr:ATP-binding cassette domain-containing protein [Xanthomonadaceae bacterium]ODU34772.1 MAG: ABC transporter ATP-binding protein [Xanthomonadaceae bacterium SCN 69-320]ODV19667.1 MAG: ABC transporter ATP-binding protein [Xanthomonadaceae bacterium SCN 69-25]OJY95026.1 MAG: ABC transporter ATP-binding protein [Xanthomonadales bacterium 69-70]
MLRFDSVALRRGSKLLFADASVQLHTGWRVGVTGRNGAGKSSLFALVAGELQPDAGDFSRPRDWVLAHVRQETPALAVSGIDYVLDGDREYREIEGALKHAETEHDALAQGRLHERLQAIGGYAARARAAALMHGLGFKPGEEQRKVAEFSGGWRMRLNLAQALMCRSDLLLLDEPTNHLDLDAVFWLEDWLRRYEGTLLLISHDREFLDNVVSHVLEIAEEKVELFAGNLSGFERKRAERLVQQQLQYERQQRERAHLQSFVDRFKAKASKARQAQSRVKALERMVEIAPIRAASSIRFEFREPEALPYPLARLDDASAGYGERTVLANVKFGLVPGDRVALLGANGAGKSTLIKLLSGAIENRSGERFEAKGLRIGYFAQHQLETLDPQASAVEHLKRLDDKLGEQAARDFLGGFGFLGDRALEPVAPFSGGEKARLCLALVVWQRPNLLLLDEPTNHLDLDMREALTEALNGFDGAVVLVAHDRALIRTCCETLLFVGGGRVQPYEGDLEDYARIVLRQNAETTATAAAAPASGGGARKPDRRERADQRAREAPLRKEIQKLDKRMNELAERKHALEAALLDPALYETPSTRAAELTRELGLVAGELGRVEDEWLVAQESLEQATAD